MEKVTRDWELVVAWVVIAVEGEEWVETGTGAWEFVTGGSSSSSESKAVISAAALFRACLIGSLGKKGKAGSWFITLAGGGWEDREGS